MSHHAVPDSASFDDVILALHTCSDLRSLFRAASEGAAKLFAAADSCLVLSRGPGLPGLVWRMQEGGVQETFLDPRWLLGPMAGALRHGNGPCLLDVSSGTGDAARVPQALFPGLTLDVALGMPVPFGRNDLHAFVLIGGRELAATPSTPALGLFHRHFQTALDRFLRMESESSIVLALRGFVSNSCTGLVTLDWDLRPCYSNRSAIQLCEAWVRGLETDGPKNPKGRVSLPEQIFRECVQLKIALAGQKAGEERPELLRVLDCSAVPGLRASVRLVRPAAAGLRRPFFQVRLERPIGASGQGRNRKNGLSDDMRNFLSPSEREILEVAAEGLSNEEIANRLGKSLATVKSQIQSIYRKLSISNRSELIARISGFTPSKAEH